MADRQRARRRREAPAGDDAPESPPPGRIRPGSIEPEAACSRGSRASAGVRRNRFSAARPSSTTTSASLTDRMIPYRVSISARKTLELDDREPKAGQHQHSHHRHREAREPVQDRKQSVGRPPRHRHQRRQRADPKGHANAMQEHRRPGQPLRRRGRGVTARRQRQADAGHRQRRQHPANARRRAAPGDDARRPSPRWRSAATAPDWWQGAGFPWRRGHDVAERKIEHIEALQPQRCHGADETDDQSRDDHDSTGARRRDPGGEEHPANADEQPEIDADPRQPDQGGAPGASAVCAAACPVGTPIENTSDPPTGCPSAEITR